MTRQSLRPHRGPKGGGGFVTIWTGDRTQVAITKVDIIAR